MNRIIYSLRNMTSYVTSILGVILTGQTRLRFGSVWL